MLILKIFLTYLWTFLAENGRSHCPCTGRTISTLVIFCTRSAFSKQNELLQTLFCTKNGYPSYHNDVDKTYISSIARTNLTISGSFLTKLPVKFKRKNLYKLKRIYFLKFILGLRIAKNGPQSILGKKRRKTGWPNNVWQRWRFFSIFDPHLRYPAFEGGCDRLISKRLLEMVQK